MTAGHGGVNETLQEVAGVEADVGSQGVTKAPHSGGGPVLEGKSPFQIAMSRLRQDRVAVTCIVVVFLFILMGIFAPLLAGLEGQSPTETHFDLVGQDTLPTFYVNSQHWLGVTSQNGFDVFARFVYGIRPSFLISISASVLTTMIGVIAGLFSGFFGGWIDNVIGWLVDFALSLPALLFAIALTPVLTQWWVGSNATGNQVQKVRIAVLMIVLVGLGWAQTCRLVRGELLSLREREFVQAARSLGAPTSRVLFKEILPNLTSLILVSFTTVLPAFVGLEAGLSYLGVGLTIPTADWGLDIAQGQQQMQNFALPLLVPLVGLLLLVLCLSLLGDAVSDAFNPNTRR